MMNVPRHFWLIEPTSSVTVSTALALGGSRSRDHGCWFGKRRARCLIYETARVVGGKGGITSNGPKLDRIRALHRGNGLKLRGTDPLGRGNPDGRVHGRSIEERPSFGTATHGDIGRFRGTRGNRRSVGHNGNNDGSQTGWGIHQEIFIGWRGQNTTRRCRSNLKKINRETKLQNQNTRGVDNNNNRLSLLVHSSGLHYESYRVLKRQEWITFGG